METRDRCGWPVAKGTDIHAGTIYMPCQVVHILRSIGIPALILPQNTDIDVYLFYTFVI